MQTALISAKPRSDKEKLFLWWFNLAGGQVPSKAALSLPLLHGQGRENTTKGSWVEIRAGRDHSPTTIMGETYLAWGN